MVMSISLVNHSLHWSQLAERYPWTWGYMLDMLKPFGIFIAFEAFGLVGISKPVAAFPFDVFSADGGEAEVPKRNFSGGIGFSILCLQSRQRKWKSSRSASSFVMPLQVMCSHTLHFSHEIRPVPSSTFGPCKPQTAQSKIHSSSCCWSFSSSL